MCRFCAVVGCGCQPCFVGASVIESHGMVYEPEKCTVCKHLQVGSPDLYQ
jgi:hypothetical protein